MMVWCGMSCYPLQLANGAAAATRMTIIGQSWCARALRGLDIRTEMEPGDRTCLTALMCVRTACGGEVDAHCN